MFLKMQRCLSPISLDYQRKLCKVPQRREQVESNKCAHPNQDALGGSVLWGNPSGEMDTMNILYLSLVPV
jgi:hypothetical protein